jgi:hypothetical protein
VSSCVVIPVGVVLTPSRNLGYGRMTTSESSRQCTAASRNPFESRTSKTIFAGLLNAATAGKIDGLVCLTP